MFRLLIIGATGLVGGKALSLALRDSRVTSVVVISRRPITAHPKLENHVVDFDALPRDAPYWNVDAALCALGTTKREATSKAAYDKVDVDYPRAIAELVKKHGARSFALVSSSGASACSPFSYLSRKAHVETLLTKIGFSSLTIVRPSFIVGEREKPRRGEILVSSIMNTLDPILPKRWRPISAERIAKSMLNSVLNPKPGITIYESDKL